jgi:hypothetical protein
LPEEVKTLGEDFCPTHDALWKRGVHYLDPNVIPLSYKCLTLGETKVATQKSIKVKVMESIGGSLSLDYINFWNSHTGGYSPEKVGESSWINVSDSLSQSVTINYPKEMIINHVKNAIGVSMPGITAGTLGAKRAWYMSDNIWPGWWKVAEDKTLNTHINYWIVDEQNYTADKPEYGGKVRPMTYGEWFNRIETIYLYVRNTSDGAPAASSQAPTSSSSTLPGFDVYIPNPYIHGGTSSADVASVIGEWDKDESSSTETTEPTAWSLRRGVSMDEMQVSVNTVEELTEESSDFKPKCEVNLYPNGHYEIIEIDYSNDNK